MKEREPCAWCVAAIAAALAVALLVASWLAEAQTIEETLAFTSPTHDTAGAALPAEVQGPSGPVPYFDRCRLIQGPSGTGPWSVLKAPQRLDVGPGVSVDLAVPLPVPGALWCAWAQCVDRLGRGSTQGNVVCLQAQAAPPPAATPPSPSAFAEARPVEDLRQKATTR